MKWINAEDEKPESGLEVIVFAPKCHINGSILIGVYFRDTDQWIVYDFYEAKTGEPVTHWMPRPEPPKQEK